MIKTYLLTININTIFPRIKTNKKNKILFLL